VLPPPDFESGASTNFATPAQGDTNLTHFLVVRQPFFKKWLFFIVLPAEKDYGVPVSHIEDIEL
jgi:hypothetical protein